MGRKESNQTKTNTCSDDFFCSREESFKNGNAIWYFEVYDREDEHEESYSCIETYLYSCFNLLSNERKSMFDSGDSRAVSRKRCGPD